MRAARAHDRRTRRNGLVEGADIADINAHSLFDLDLGKLADQAENVFSHIHADTGGAHLGFENGVQLFNDNELFDLFGESADRIHGTTPTVTSPPKKDTEQTDPPKETEETTPPKATETTKPVEKTTEATEPPSTEAPTETTQSTEPEEQPEKTTQSEPPSTYEIESLVAQYINKYRAAQGDTTVTVLAGLTEVARYRARQLVTDFSHNSNPNPCTVLQYGEYIDMTLFGGDASESYYRGYNREAIGKGDWFGTADQMAQRIAEGFKKSSSHWAYVGDSEYSYMAVGVIYNEADEKWYCCICMSSKNYGD